MPLYSFFDSDIFASKLNIGPSGPSFLASMHNATVHFTIKNKSFLKLQLKWEINEKTHQKRELSRRIPEYGPSSKGHHLACWIFRYFPEKLIASSAFIFLTFPLIGVMLVKNASNDFLTFFHDFLFCFSNFSDTSHYFLFSDPEFPEFFEIGIRCLLGLLETECPLKGRQGSCQVSEEGKRTWISSLCFLTFPPGCTCCLTR